MPATSLYVHIPFCRQRCGYCDFNTYAGLESLIPSYCAAIGREIELLTEASEARYLLHTIYFGGGTPSLLPLPQLEKILGVIQKHFPLHSNPEITLEANPGTLDREYLKGIRQLGINRLSLGMQSANQAILRLLDRLHSPVQVLQSVRWGREAGFDNINLDLIYGIPTQSLDDWKKTLSIALSLAPEHMSLYALTIEQGTPFKSWVDRGLVEEPDPDLAADMYEYAMDVLEENRFEHYEISNWAKKNGDRSYVSRHNLQYWRNLPYIGIGAGAHGYLENMRTANVAHPHSYIKRIKDGKVLPFPQTPATLSLEIIDKRVEIGETLMMGLRLLQEGVSKETFWQRFGENLKDGFEVEIETLIDKGLLEWGGEDQNILRLTRRGYLLGNQVFQVFI